MNQASVYLETSFISYLAARPSRDIIVAAHQNISLDWWEKRRQDFELFISQVVVDEVKLGNPEASVKRLKILEGITSLDITREIEHFATRLINYKIIPPDEVRDAVHIAVSCVHGINYLLTWNCRHIANAEKHSKIGEICTEFGYISPTICTPEELLGG